MIKLANRDACTGCGACAAICPRGCIVMCEDDEGFLFPKLNGTLCAQCKQCEAICPALKEPRKTGKPIQTFAAQALQQPLRMESSSGGVFSLLALETLREGGVVFGAALDSKCEVFHTGAENEEALSELRGSKYMQSRMGNTLQAVKTALENGRQVLFSATACQISGLRAYLGRDYANLLCVEVVCHGVPSVGVWREHICQKEAEIGKLLKSVNFRNKETGWRSYSVEYQFEDGSRQLVASGKDPFLRGFIADLYLRRSCTDCAHKASLADLTLGDCWGLEHLAAQMDDEKGTSIVLIRSQKGQAAFERIESKLKRQPIDYEIATKYNPALQQGVHENPKRAEFFAQRSEPFAKKVERLTKVGLTAKCKRKLGAIFRRIKGE